MEETARPGELRDLERVVELAAAAIAELTPTRGGEVWSRIDARPAPIEASLRDALTDPSQHLVVGELDSVIVGYAVVRIDQLRDGGRLAVLDDLYVDVGARGVGLGETMMNAVLEWATDQGCFGIDSMALPGNRATKNFFESFGLVARAIVVHRPLKGPTDDEAPAS